MKVKVYMSSEIPGRAIPADAFVGNQFCHATGRIVSRVLRLNGEFVPEWWWNEYIAPDGARILGNY